MYVKGTMSKDKDGGVNLLTVTPFIDRTDNGNWVAKGSKFVMFHQCSNSDGLFWLYSRLKIPSCAGSLVFLVFKFMFN